MTLAPLARTATLSSRRPLVLPPLKSSATWLVTLAPTKLLLLPNALLLTPMEPLILSPGLAVIPIKSLRRVVHARPATPPLLIPPPPAHPSAKNACLTATLVPLLLTKAPRRLALPVPLDSPCTTEAAATTTFATTRTRSPLASLASLEQVRQVPCAGSTCLSTGKVT